MAFLNFLTEYFTKKNKFNAAWLLSKYIYHVFNFFLLYKIYEIHSASK